MRSEASRAALGFAALLTAVMLAVTAFPVYFYASLALRQDDARHQARLQAYAQEIVERMAVFESGSQELFVFPRSPLFKAGLYDARGGAIFTLLASPPADFKPGYAADNRQAVWIEPLGENLFGARFLAVCAPHDRNEVYLRLLMLFATLLLVFWAGSYLLIDQFLRPFERTRRIQELFFKDAMHEIKTPLGVISINLELLGEKFGALAPVKRMRYAVKTLSTVYEDIEHLIRHRYVTYAKEPIDLGRFAQSRIDYFQDVAQMRPVTLTGRIAPEVRLAFSRVELQRLIDNNLSNAIKYSRENGVVNVTLELKENAAVLSFTDNGVGMDDTRSIFTRHYRGDEIKGGFGIGLSIVKAICDKNGVGIKVVSKKGEGSRFEYRFPLKTAA
ncbi:MAG: sensor histidine kinase [Campylobacterales bacterium]